LRTQREGHHEHRVRADLDDRTKGWARCANSRSEGRRLLRTDIHHEQVSSVAERTELELVLERILRAGDVLVVTKLDRLARSVADLVAIMMRLKTSGAALRVLDTRST
jgi:DNA invertase Pin-like site-specific DNA recombinase